MDRRLPADKLGGRGPWGLSGAKSSSGGLFDVAPLLAEWNDSDMGSDDMERLRLKEGGSTGDRYCGGQGVGRNGKPADGLRGASGGGTRLGTRSGPA